MKKTQSQAFSNLIGALLFLALGIYALVQSFGFQTIKNTYVQAATFPQIMAAGMLIFSVALLIQSILQLKAQTPKGPAAERAASIDVLHNKGVQGALVVVVLCVLFVALFNTLGYVICSAVLSVAIMLLIGKRNWVQIILVSILVPLGMWLIFYKVLTVNIPMGPLNFLRDLIDMI